MYKVNEFLTEKKKLDDIKLFGMKGYEAAHFLEQPLMSYMRGLEIITAKSLLTPFFYIGYKYPEQSCKDKVIMFQSLYYAPRKDMHVIYDNVSSTVENSIKIRGEYAKIFKAGNLLNFFRSLVWLIQLRKIKLGAKGKMFLLSCAAKSVNFRKYIEEHKALYENANAFITLNDENYDESIFVQFCQHNGIPTATLQHGHFRRVMYDKTLIELTNPFYNFTADKFFAWGEYAKQAAVCSGIDEGRIRIVGNPKFIGLSSFPTPSADKVFGVVLDGGGSETLESNKGMLACADRIAEVTGYTYIIKQHPVYDLKVLDGAYDKSNLSYVFDRKGTVFDFAECVGFSLVSGSSVYSELLYMHQTAFRYVMPGTDDKYSGIDAKAVTSADEAAEVVKQYLENPEAIKKELEKSSERLCGKGVLFDNYKKAISDLERITKI